MSCGLKNSKYKMLRVGKSFNAQVEAAVFPDGMHRIELSDYFIQPIAGVKWPPGLRVLKLGQRFNRVSDSPVNRSCFFIIPKM